MKYLNSLKIYIVFQVVFGLIGMAQVFGGPAHISGVVHGYSQPTIAHISGEVYLGGNSPIVKTHVSGSKKVLPIQKPEPVQSKMIRKARNIGVTLSSPKKSTSTKGANKTTEKNKTNARTARFIEQTILKDRIKERKACWKTCENTWKVDFKERCSVLSDSLMQHCKKELFKERLTCVRKNCREITQ